MKFRYRNFVEMQTTDPGNLPLRSRYYQAQIDVGLLTKGVDYKALNKSFVIFICMKDIFEQGRPIYTFESRCIQDASLALKDRAAKIFLNPHAKMDGVSTKLANFLNFLVDGKPVDEYTERLVEAVKTAKNNKYLGVEYMSMLANQMDAFDRGHDEGLFALVRTLKPILVDFDKVFDAVAGNKEYADITKEKVMKFFQMCP